MREGKFCGVCRHPEPGHEADCPVLTQEPQPVALSEQHLLGQKYFSVGQQLEAQKQLGQFGTGTTVFVVEVQVLKERIAQLETWVRDVVDTIEDSRHRKRGEALLEKGNP